MPHPTLLPQLANARDSLLRREAMEFLDIVAGYATIG